MKNKKIEIQPEPIKKSNKYRIIGWLLIFTVAGFSAWSANNHMKVQARIKQYETTMNKRIYSACGCVDEEGTYATITDWKDSDPELKGFPKDPETGRLGPIKDRKGNIVKELPNGYPGIKDQHIPFIRGFRYADGYGESFCIPCAKAEDQYQINICNSRHLYVNMTITYSTEKIDIENIDEANPALVAEIPNQESEQEILRQQQEVWVGEMQQSGGFPKNKSSSDEPRSKQSY